MGYVDKLADKIAEQDEIYRTNNWFHERYDYFDEFEEWEDLDGYFSGDFDEEEFSTGNDECTPVAYL